MNYPVSVAQVVVDSNQGTNVILKSGLKPGDQVVTDGQEKLQAGSRVIPRPSDDMQAAHKAAAAQAGGAKPDAGDARPAADDATPAVPGGPRHRGAGNAPTDSTGLGTSHGPDGNREGANGTLPGKHAHGTHSPAAQ